MNCITRVYMLNVNNIRWQCRHRGLAGDGAPPASVIYTYQASALEARQTANQYVGATTHSGGHPLSAVIR